MTLLIALAILVLPGLAHAALCKEWASPQKVGALDTSFINEASGISFSRAFSGRVYHHNDSGDGVFFYLTDSAGAHTQKIAFNSEAHFDMEDMAIGACTEGTCLYIGDIGCNAEKRASIDL